MRVSTCVFGVIFSMSAFAGDLESCAELDSSAARLECYDELAGRESRQDSSAPEVAATPAAPDAAVAPEKPAEPPAPMPDKHFGKPAKEAQAAFAEAAGMEEINAIRGTVTSATKDGRGRVTVVLDNGQRWQQVRKEYFKVKPGNEVIVERAVLGSYSMRNTSGGRWTKVRRVD